MKKVYKTLALCSVILLGSTFAFAQTVPSTSIDEETGIVITTSGASIVVEGADSYEIVSINGTKVNGKKELASGFYIVKAKAGKKVKVEKVAVK